MERILVTGAGGGLGSNVVRAAHRRGLAVRALVRDSTKARMPDGVEVVSGDAVDAASLTRAAEGCAALFHLVNVVINRDWVSTTSRLLDAALTACRATGARLVFPANVWVFGRGSPGQRVAEGAPARPCSEKGAARASKEDRIRASSVRWVMVRLPEFYGPHVQTLTGPPLQRISRGQRAWWFGPADVPVELVYMPDAAEAIVEVGLLAGADGEVFHLPGAAPITAREFFSEAARQQGGGSFRAVPAGVVRAAALVNPMARSFADILHLWEHPILLDGAKLRARLPQLRTTPYAEGHATTLAWLRDNPGARMYF